jgi:hypothetical protein
MSVRLFVLGLPGSGKSTAARYIEMLARDCGWETSHFNDCDVLFQMVLADEESPSPSVLGAETRILAQIEAKLSSLVRRIKANPYKAETQALAQIEAKLSSLAPITVKVLYCYAREDKAFRDELDNHLSALKHSGQITTWCDREISPGTEWEHELSIHLESANLILLLISADFLASDYCWSKEMSRSLERHQSGEAYVIPVILRAVHCKGTPISELQFLPTDGKPITQWLDRDHAFEDVTHNISEVVTRLRTQLEEEQKRRQCVQEELKTNFEELKKRINNRNRSLDRLETKIQAQTRQKNRLQAQIKAIQDKLTELETNVASSEKALSAELTEEEQLVQECKNL